MPQEIRVLECSKCMMYQVDIVKKAQVWKCKMCGVKQCVGREFHRGTGSSCRQEAQRLNLVGSQHVESQCANILKMLDEDINLDNIVQSKESHLKTDVSRQNMNISSITSELLDDEDNLGWKQSFDQNIENTTIKPRASKWTNFV